MDYYISGCIGCSHKTIINDANYESLDELEGIARAHMVLSPYYKQDMLKNKDLLASCCTAIWAADATWDSKRENRKGKRNRRIDFVNWELQRFRRSTTKKKEKRYINEDNVEPLTYDSEIDDTAFALIVEKAVLSAKEADSIKRHILQGIEMTVLAKEQSITKQGIKSRIEKGLRKIRQANKDGYLKCKEIL